MVAPNETKDSGHSNRKVNAFSAKRLGIQRANSVMFGSLIGASIIVSFSLVTLNFLWNLRGFNNRVIEARTDAVNTLNENINNVESLELSFQSLEIDDVNSQVVLDALPSKYDFPALATSIERLVSADGLTLDSFSGDDQSDQAIQKAIEPTPIEMPFSLTLKGGYEELVDLVGSFERTIRPLYIDSLELRGTDNNLRAQLRVRSFYQPAVDVEIETETIQ